jgi:hypothetical protein
MLGEATEVFLQKKNWEVAIRSYNDDVTLNLTEENQVQIIGKFVQFSITKNFCGTFSQLLLYTVNAFLYIYMQHESLETIYVRVIPTF